ncbi:hypothetical protein CLOM_g5175 [Closterium sp. NIES-68]|nr:hypothetical protein CLOM_g5175 [Closterium sp. NIES-68]GJP82952.1 hypothetical protein CLOP_g13170 [Closterium sp. NIES-67]
MFNSVTSTVQPTNPQDPLGGYQDGSGASVGNGGAPARNNVGNNVQLGPAGAFGPSNVGKMAEGGFVAGGDPAAEAPGSEAAPAPACSASPMRDYTSRVFIKPGWISLHWTVINGTQVKIALVAKVGSGAAKGWIALGFSNSGAMVPADAVIGNTEDVPIAAYSILGYGQQDVVRTDNFSIGADASVEMTTRRTTLKFSRSLGDGGMIPINFSGPNTLIWAHDLFGNKTIGYHFQKQGSLVVDFSCVGTDYSYTGPIDPTVPGSPQTPTPGGNSLCAASSLDGFTYSIPLEGDSFRLHWSPPVGNQVNVALEGSAGSEAARGWMSLGWSRTGSMVPADAVIGNFGSGGVSAFYMTGYRRWMVVQTGAVPLGATSVSNSLTGSRVIKFTLTGGAGNVPLDFTGANRLIWAHSVGGSKVLSYHGSNFGALTLDFTCKTAPSNSGSSGGNDYFDDADQAREDRRAARWSVWNGFWSGFWGGMVGGGN